MRSIISTIFAIILFIFVIYLANSGSIVLPDYWTGLAVALTVTAFGILYWGFKPQIHRFFKEKRRIQGGETEIAPSTEVETRKSTLLPDSAKITELNIDDKLLDQLYEEAHAKALDIYHDAQLSYFVIQVLPYALGGSDVNIYMDFYSKWADKLCRFQYAELTLKLKHYLPDKRPMIDSDREVFTTLPWKTSPQWMQFLRRVYDRIKPLSSAKGTCYHLSAHPNRRTYWTVKFEDGLSGNEYLYEWDGRGLDEKSIKQMR